MALISVSELLLVEIERAAVEKQYDLLNKVRIMEAKQERDEINMSNEKFDKAVKKIYSIHSEIMYGVNNNDDNLLRWNSLHSRGRFVSSWLLHVCRAVGHCAA
jgi:hypothetical protein